MKYYLSTDKRKLSPTTFEYLEHFWTLKQHSWENKIWKHDMKVISRTQKVSKFFEILKYEHITKHFEGVSIYNLNNSAFEHITVITEIRRGCDTTLITNCNIKSPWSGIHFEGFFLISSFLRHTKICNMPSL